MSLQRPLALSSFALSAIVGSVGTHHGNSSCKSYIFSNIFLITFKSANTMLKFLTLINTT